MRRVLLGVSALVFLGACGGGGADGVTNPTPPPASTAVATVSVALSASLTVGSTATATAELRTAAGAVVTGRAVSWTTSAPTVATVNDAGTVTALATGAVTITATSEGKSGAASLTVIPAPVATVAITLALPSLTLGTTTTASAVLRDERGATLTGRSVVWSSSTPAVATVDNSGAITTLAVGTTSITATSEGKSASATLTVIPVPVATVTVAGAATLAPGAVGSFTATLRDASGATLSNRVVTWTSSDANVAAVSASGSVTAIAPGTATITASSEGKSGAASLTVIPAPVATVVVTLGLSSLTLGTTTTASVVLRDERGGTLTGRAVVWSSSTPSVATVGNSGAIATLTVGSTVITATSEGKSASATLTVTPVPVGMVTAAIPQPSLTVGSSTQVTATVRSVNGQVLTDRVITWSSSAPTVASVNSSGVVLAVAAGTAIITATSEGRTATVAVTVLAPTPAVVQVSPASVSLAPSQTASLTATVRDASGNVMTGQTVLWSTSSNSVATVTQTGVITGVAPGIVSITATSGGRSAAATVTVQPAVVAAVYLNYATTTIVAGDIRVLIATARDAANNIVSGRAVSWTSTNLTVVDGYVYGDTAVITGLKSGSATITATIDGRSASAIVNVLAPTSSICSTIAGASIYGDDNEYLGRFTNQYDSQSVLNEFGAYGSPYRSTSTNNTYGTYGSPYSSLSARNPYASRPPRIIKNGAFLAYYTANSFKTPAVSPAYAMSCIFP